MNRIHKHCLLCFTLMFFPAFLTTHHSLASTGTITHGALLQSFLDCVTGSSYQRQKSVQFIQQNWQDSFIPMMIEIIPLNHDQNLNTQLIQILESQTGQRFGFNLDKWYLWIWQQNLKPHPIYTTFKASLYRLIDPKFENYFNSKHPHTIRLDEIRWGGVKQDGIPPLRYPKMIYASQANYLKDDHIVFGIAVNGDIRAYPKRILAWHEMFIDNVGNIPIAGVYCTLCGTMIIYKTVHQGVPHRLGTSGFLYRSNKLMYDKKTQSLWNTLWGKPVIGPLVGKGIQLEKLNVVTTTWGEWRRRHPKTKVLSIQTGYKRDYNEGAAYRSYFATDDLMFVVPDQDRRLKNKAEILGVIFVEQPDQPIAIFSHFLKNQPVYNGKINDQTFVVLTDASGAHRLYETNNIIFKNWDQNFNVIDEEGQTWMLSEDSLTRGDGKKLFRRPTHNAFWFGWHAAYPRTKLIQ